MPPGGVPGNLPISPLGDKGVPDPTTSLGATGEFGGVPVPGGVVIPSGVGLGEPGPGERVRSAGEGTSVGEEVPPGIGRPGDGPAVNGDGPSGIETSRT